MDEGGGVKLPMESMTRLGQASLSDETPDPVRLGAQYAMERRDPYQQIIGGRVRGGEGGAGGSGAVPAPANANVRPPMPANTNTSQAEVRAMLPPPLPTKDRIWQNYGAYLRDIGPDAALRSEPLWSGAARISTESGIAEHEAFSQLANEFFARNGLNRYMSPEMAKSFMRQERGRAAGIKGIE